MLHEVDYPCIPGKGGIDLKRVLFPGYYELKPGASGRLLSFEISERSIRIEDAHRRQYCLVSWIEKDSSQIAFDFHTKVHWYEWGIRRVHGRHPDLFASKFVDVAFTYFASQGMLIEQALGYWVRESDNFHDFMRSVRAGKTPVDAANTTWTGKQYERHGFKVMMESDVQFKNLPPPKLIVATFYKE